MCAMTRNHRTRLESGKKFQVNTVQLVSVQLVSVPITVMLNPIIRAEINYSLTPEIPVQVQVHPCPSPVSRLPGGISFTLLKLTYRVLCTLIFSRPNRSSLRRVGVGGALEAGSRKFPHSLLFYAWRSRTDSETWKSLCFASTRPKLEAGSRKL